MLIRPLSYPKFGFTEVRSQTWIAMAIGHAEFTSIPNVFGPCDPHSLQSRKRRLHRRAQSTLGRRSWKRHPRNGPWCWGSYGVRLFDRLVPRAEAEVAAEGRGQSWSHCQPVHPSLPTSQNFLGLDQTLPLLATLKVRRAPRWKVVGCPPATRPDRSLGEGPTANPALPLPTDPPGPPTTDRHPAPVRLP